ncbi:F0F1 ATP synthase subunit B [Desulforamulus ruminis]|uniref:ATP synthase subunit b n=1 Tax=Desulforamulus ruminis (strain ATCC 23193 / DSM 2154 / NCIMB 8452 / DL) TaxID=696281 RepID=F6DP63_DESRL|nr:F0F1 ATP synthase subunit B [Desulforamulus ruminis]AEG61892.1 ATP synthase F0, B subunit [Desulforamulus ruminis DSM 2154]
MESLGFNGTILAQMFNFLVLLILLRAVAYKPFMNMLEKRKELIESSIAAAEEDKKQAEQLRASLQAELKRTREEAAEIMAKATKNAEEQAQQIIEAAKAEANRVKDSAVVEIQREKEKAVSELRDQVATLSILVAGKIIDQKLNDDIQKDLVNKFVKEAGDLPC